MTKSGTSISYLYSGDDNRIYKAVSTTQKEWHIRTGGGADLGVFDISNNKYIWYVFGAERVAKIDHVPTLTITEAAGNTGGNLYTSDPFVIPLNVGSNLPAPIADYYAYDHLGNTRLVYRALIGCASSVPNYQLRYAGDYYPFGKVLREWTTTTSEKYLYTQKERDKETGLDYFGARYYDSELGRFLGVDPMAEKYLQWSSFHYSGNNPISNIDENGMEWSEANKELANQYGLFGDGGETFESFFDNEEQRLRALAQAQKYVEKKLEGNQYKMGKKGGPGDLVDCSGLTSNCVVAGGERNPNYGNYGSGVLNTEGNLVSILEGEVVPGNLITFHFDKGYPYHIGIIKDVIRDNNGKIVSWTIIESAGGVGPRLKTFDENSKYGRNVFGYYKWDMIPENIVNPFDIIRQPPLLHAPADVNGN